jgi:hypothetical protein
MDNVIANEHVQVLIPPDAGKRDTPRPGWHGGRYTAMREVLATDYAGGLYRRRKAMSSRCSRRPRTTGASISFSAEADPPHARSGG